MTCDFGNDMCHDDGLLCEVEGQRSFGVGQRYLCDAHLVTINSFYAGSSKHEPVVYVRVTPEQEHERFQSRMKELREKAQ